eukprot:7030946-Pyramimonas_sp.AAC.1
MPCRAQRGFEPEQRPHSSSGGSSTADPDDARRDRRDQSSSRDHGHMRPKAEEVKPPPAPRGL